MRSKLLVRVVVLEKVRLLVGKNINSNHHYPKVDDEHAGILLLQYHGDADDGQQNQHHHLDVVARLLHQPQIR